jgi:hypothetical protein
VDEVEVRVREHPALNDLSGVIGGAVVDDENLGVPVALGDAGEDAIEGAFDAGAFVISGNNDAEAGRVHDVRFARAGERSGGGAFHDTSFFYMRFEIRKTELGLEISARGDVSVGALLHSAA